MQPQEVLDSENIVRGQPFIESTIFGYPFQTPYFIMQEGRVVFLVHCINIYIPMISSTKEIIEA